MSRYYDLGNLSGDRSAGSVESAPVQYELSREFLACLEELVPPDTVVCNPEPLNSAWRFKVLFRGRDGTVTDDYRTEVRSRFPGATVRNISGDDEWILPFTAGSERGQSACLTLLMFCFCALLVTSVGQVVFS